MRNAVRSHAMGAERACAPGSMALLTRLAKQVYRRSTEELLGMHMRHLMALSYVRDHDGGPQQEIAEALCMDANNVVLLLNELEQLGYVSRRRDLSDLRRHLVDLTPVGLTALDDAERATLWQLLGRALRGAEPELAAACEDSESFSAPVSAASA